MPTGIIIGISSDIGRELGVRFAEQGWNIWGTTRSRSRLSEFPSSFNLMPCDLMSHDSVAAVIETFSRKNIVWDALILAAGTEEPIGLFWERNADEWDDSVRVNALGPLRLTRGLYPLRNRAGRPNVVFFSGAGSNGPAPAYSAYSASKVFLIKMCELLDAESEDTSVFIIGPGIVRTKIHEQTLRAAERGGANYRKVVEFLASPNPGVSHDDIYACLRWCMAAGKSVIGGRNLSLVHDPWRNGGIALMQELKKNEDFYKLRRFGNDFQAISK